VEQVGLLAKLRDMLQDGNGMVVSNATAAITEIKATKGLWFELTPKIVHALLNAIPETGEWGRISILDFLADNLKAN
jgi:vesicle coat complex subunit